MQGNIISCYKLFFLISNIADAKEISIYITVRVLSPPDGKDALIVLIW